jgi:hypothetical protein
MTALAIRSHSLAPVDDQGEGGLARADQQVEARARDGGVAAVNVICWPTIGANVVSKARMNCSRSRTLSVVRVNKRRAQEIEHRADAAVVEKSKAANLIAWCCASSGEMSKKGRAACRTCRSSGRRSSAAES